MEDILKDLEQKLCSQLGISDKKELENWKQEKYLMNEETVNEFWRYVQDAPHIIVVGDYDVDGVMASLIMTKSIKTLYPDKKVGVRIPKRMSEGYGFNESIADEIRQRLPAGSLVITVDNGIAAASPLEKLYADGYHVIVTDHHELGSNKIPDVDMVLNPKVRTANYPFTGDYWCGAAVAYKIVQQIVPPNLVQELSIYASIATVADCMPLKEGNWALVRKGIEDIRAGKAPKSVNELIIKLGQSPENTSEETFGYYVGPAVNAPGRLYDDGAKFSLSYFLNPTDEKCSQLVEYNMCRRNLRDEQLEELEEIIRTCNMAGNCPIWVQAPDLHEGIVGILAGKISEKYGVPAIVLTQSEKDENVLKGSARSVPGINIFEYLQSVDKYLVGYGGHAGAAGLSIRKEDFDKARMHQLDRPKIQEEDAPIHIPKNLIPQVAALNAVFAPFGEENPAPRFDVDISLSKNPNADMIGNPPLHLCVNDPLRKYKIMHFNHKPNDLRDQEHFRLTGGIRYDIFRAKKTAVLTADSVEDYEIDEKEKSR